MDLEALATDNTETVTYTAVAPDGTTGAPFSVPYALKRATEGQDQGGVAQAVQDTARWHLWVSQMAGVRPKQADRITRADGSVWVVLPDGVKLMAAGTRWQAETRRELGT